MRNFKLFFLLISVVFVLSACVTNKSAQVDTTKIDGGLFKSANKGANWQQKVLFPNVSGRAASFSFADNASLAMDPTDNKAIYYGSVGNGLFYSYDAGETWQMAAGLGKTTVRAIAVDPKDKCTIYASIGNKVFKTVDCNRNWAQIYFDNDLAVNIDALVIDPFNSSSIYIGLSRGDIIKSWDAGQSWHAIHRIKSSIKKIVIDPNNSLIIYVATPKIGIQRTKDGGKTWDDLSKQFNELKLGNNIQDIVLTKDFPGNILVATDYGVIRSADNAETWEKLELLTPERNAIINALAVNPKDFKEIYYTTKTTFYRTFDAAFNWSTIKLPTSRAGWNLIVDPADPSIIYMAVRGAK